MSKRLEEIRKNIKEIMETPYVVRHKKAKEVGIDLVMTGKVDFLLQEIDSLNDQNKRYHSNITELVLFIETSDEELHRKLHKTHVVLDKLLEGESIE